MRAATVQRRFKARSRKTRSSFAVAFEVEGSKITGAFRGTVDGNKMSGSVEFEGAGSGTWSAERAKPAPK